MSVLFVDWLDPGHHTREWPVAKIEAVTSVAVSLSQLLVRVKVLKHCFELVETTRSVRLLRNKRVVLVG